MSKKIIITGGLGYIGTELCKLYSGVSWHHKITIIDNRFISERVSQIRNWNMEFVQGDILDKDLITKYFEDADVVHHLAGITDVPRTKSESSEIQDEKIKKVAEEGTQNILDSVDDKCNLNWKYDTKSSIVGSPILEDGKIYFGTLNRKFYSMNAADGKLQ